MPYVWLALTGLMVFVGLARIGRLQTKVGLIFVTGALIAFSDLVVILFRLYRYRTGLIASPTPDSRLGMFLSDGLFVPLFVSAVVGIVPRRRYLVSLPIVISLLCIEQEFSLRGWFIHLHWKLWYSAGLFLTYLLLINAWAGYFERTGYSLLNRVVLTITSLYYSWTWYTVLTSGVLNLYTLRTHWLPDQMLDNVLSGFLLRFLPFGTVGLIWVWNRWVERPAYVALLVTILAGWYLLLISLGVYHLRAPWHPLYATLSATLLVLCAGGVDRWFARQETGTDAAIRARR